MKYNSIVRAGGHNFAAISLSATLLSHAAVGDIDNVEFIGTWEQEWAYNVKNPNAQKFEGLVEPRIYLGFESGAQLVGIARARLDTVGKLGPFSHRPDNYSSVNGPLYNNEHAEISLRELFIDFKWAEIDWRLGKQQVVWGQADGIKVLDIVNPQSFREFILDDFDDSRIPLWMANAEVRMADSSLQLLWVPDTTYHELAEPGTPYFLTSPKWVPRFPSDSAQEKMVPLSKPDDFLRDADVGFRYSTFLEGWDMTFNYFHHYVDFPVLYLEKGHAGNQGLLQVKGEYERNHLVGGTLSNTFDGFTFRAEVAYNSDKYYTSTSREDGGIRKSAEFASVLGLDWQHSGDGLLSAQWFLSYLPDYDSDLVRDESENILSLLVQQGFSNDTWILRFLGLYSVNDSDSMIQLKLSHWLLSNLEIWLGGDFFTGKESGSFGQFKEENRVLLGFEFGF